MTAICFKLPEKEAAALRRQAHEAHMTVSEFLRDLIVKKEKKKKPRVSIVYNKITGTPAFYSKDLPPLTTERVKELLVDFP